MSSHATLLVFLKNPEPGKVKTRLAATIGPERAAGLYREWIGLVLGRLQPVRDQLEVVGLFDGGPVDHFRQWHSLADRWLPQGEGGLGERLESGFEAGHRSGRPVLAIGTDCLEVDSSVIWQALTALQDHHAVFGPAQDGGYYLVGTACHLPGFFSGIRWSSAHTLQDHLGRCHMNGWSVALLPTLRDLDTWEDWQAYLGRKG